MEKLKLVINEEAGYAYQLNLDNLIDYSEQYRSKVSKNDRSEISGKINNFRVNYTLIRGIGTSICDVGCANGHFLDQVKKYAPHIQTSGYDVLPNTKEILELNNHEFIDIPNNKDSFIPADIITAFDVIEHMINPLNFLSRINGFLIVTVPIILNFENLTSWKHFRPNEHIWYWTLDGFISLLKYAGFELIHYDSTEMEIGRDDVFTFAFYRKVKSLVLDMADFDD